MVELFRKSGKTAGEVSRDLGLTETSVRAWIRQAEIDEGKGPAGALTTAERATAPLGGRRVRTVSTAAAALALVLYVDIGGASPTFVPPPPPAMAVGASPPNSMVLASQYFDASVGGVRDLVATYRDENPDLYNQLLPKVEDLEAMKTRAWVVGLSTAVGVGLLVGGLALYKPPPAGTTPDFTPIWVGVAGVPLILCSYFIGSAFGPSRDDYLGFVNFHNRLNPGNPIRWQVGMAPSQQGPSFGAMLSLDLF